MVDCSVPFAVNTALLGQDQEAGTTRHPESAQERSAECNVKEYHPRNQLRVADSSKFDLTVVTKNSATLFSTQSHIYG